MGNLGLRVLEVVKVTRLIWSFPASLAQLYEVESHLLSADTSHVLLNTLIMNVAEIYIDIVISAHVDHLYKNAIICLHIFWGRMAEIYMHKGSRV